MRGDECRISTECDDRWLHTVSGDEQWLQTMSGGDERWLYATRGGDERWLYPVSGHAQWLLARCEKWSRSRIVSCEWLSAVVARYDW